MITLRWMLIPAVFTLSLGAADFTGKWSGTVEIKRDGQSKAEPAFVILHQDGASLTGSGGPKESDQHAIRNGKVEGNRITFEIALDNERVMHFNLTVTSDHIDGEVTAPMKDSGKPETARLSLTRVN